MALINRTYGESEDTRAFITGDWMNIIYQSGLTTTLDGGCSQTGPISDAYDYGSTNYVTLDWTDTGGESTFKYDLGEKRQIKNVTCSCGPTGTQATTYTVKIQGSNDDSSWDDLATATGSKGAGVTLYEDLTSGECNYHYIRFYFDSVQTASASSSGFQIYNLGIYI
jgi:hypothetical protein